MTPLLVAAFLLIGQTKPNPDQFPMALQKSMELDDLDREIQRVHDSAVMKRAQLASSERLAKRGLISQADLERETAEVKYQESREAELVASRAFKCYERDVRGLAIPPDERKAYALLLELVRKQIVMAQVDADYQSSQAKRTRALFLRKAASRSELDDAELAAQTSRAGVDLGRSREAQILMELAARNGEKRFDREEVHRLKADYLKARIRFFEASAEGAATTL